MIHQQPNQREYLLGTLIAIYLSGLVSQGCSENSRLNTQSSTAELAPSGSDSTLISENFPSTLVAGERVNIAVVYRNNGTASPANDWDSNYLLLSTGDIRWPSRPVVGTVAANANQDHTFYVPLTAPSTPGSYNIQYQMYASGANNGFFGQAGSKAVTVSASGTKQWDCGYVSDTLPDSPTTIAPGLVTTIQVTVQNTGSETWNTGDVCLYSRDSNFTQWGSQTCVLNTASVAPNANHTFNISITAPSSPGSYTFDRQMYQLTAIANGGIGLFDSTNNCVSISGLVGGTAPLDASFSAANSDLDENISFTPGESRVVTAAFENTGSDTWNTSDTYYLYSRNSPSTLWGTILAKGPLASNVSSGTIGTFSFVMTAPVTEGDYTAAWQLYKSSTSQFFGDTTNISINVNSSNTPQYDATVVSQSIPSSTTQRRNATFQVTMRNTGTASWVGSDFRLRSNNSPFSLWGVADTPLGGGETVAPNAERTFTFTVLAPSFGTYASIWQMDYNSVNGGVGYFGNAASTNVSVVSQCGNGVFDAGEECDDGNANDADGCSNSCLINPQSYTMDANTAASRSFHGPWSERGFTKVAIGDVTGDGIEDIILGGEITVRPTGRSLRDRAGAIYGFAGGGSFFTNGFTNADTDADFKFYGARANDRLAGLVEGTIKTGDVTGDGVDDIIVSSNGAACADGTGNCGRVYVIKGTGLSTSAYDLASLESPIVASLVAPTDGDGAVVAAVGDLTGDNIADIVVGMPYRDDSASNAGALAVVQGGVTLTGTITLSGGNILAQILGEGADTRIGYIADIGQLDNSGNNDLLVSAAGYDSSTGGSDAGGVWAIFSSSLSGTINLASTYNARWRGASIRDQFGKSVAIADITGADNPDVIIGVPGHIISGTRYGGVFVFAGPISDGTDIDFSTGTTSNVEILARDPNDYTGWCIATGDINGNGVTDLILGGPLSGGSTNGLFQAGEVVALIGGSPLINTTLSASDPITLLAGEAGARTCFYGGSLAAGDLDNDGDDDFCIGMYRANVSSSGLTNPGRVDCISSPF